MRIPIHIAICIFLFVLPALTAKGQFSKIQREDIEGDTTTTDFYPGIGKFDLSKLWMPDTTSVGPLGFIGDNYQRFYIHFVSINKSQLHPDVYEVTGKTKVKNNICNFKGTITIENARSYKAQTAPYARGTMRCKCRFREDSTSPWGGSLAGSMETYWYIDSQKHIRYDDLGGVADGYMNNIFIGTWTSYKTKASKKCHWGDGRIPACGDLDDGAGDFHPNSKYKNNGWDSFCDTCGPDIYKPEKWWR